VTGTRSATGRRRFGPTGRSLTARLTSRATQSPTMRTHDQPAGDGDHQDNGQQEDHDLTQRHWIGIRCPTHVQRLVLGISLARRQPPDEWGRRRVRQADQTCFRPLGEEHHGLWSASEPNVPRKFSGKSRVDRVA
jgi:hypothetical protein